MLKAEVLNAEVKREGRQHHVSRRAPPRPGRPAAHVSDYLALLPSGPDAVRRLRLHRFRTAVRSAGLEPLIVSNGSLQPSAFLDRMADAQHAVPFGVEEADHRLAVAGFGVPDERGELRRPAHRVQPRIAGERRQAEEALLDASRQERQRLVGWPRRASSRAT